MRRLTIGAALLGLVALGACAPSADVAPVASEAAQRAMPEAGLLEPVGGRRIGGAEYRRMVFGNTLDRQLPNGGRLSILVGADGSQRLRLVGAGGQAGSDQGRQEIRGDQICSTWQRISGGQQTCFAYFQLGTSLIAVDVSGQLQPTRFQLLPGNAAGI